MFKASGLGLSLTKPPSTQTFVRNLKQYLVPRFLRAFDPTVTDATLQEAALYLNWSNVVIKDDRIYTHKIMRIKYTTYDARRDEDIIHLDTEQTNVMLLNPAYSYGSPIHPFSYGKVIAILHAEVAFVGDIARQGAEYVYYPIEFLWVRWYKILPSSSNSELDKVELLPIDHTGAHSFIDPSQVLRACHIVPDFESGVRYQDGRGKSEVANDRADWDKYFIHRYVDLFTAPVLQLMSLRFVDRDMFMRYEWGLGVGHTYAYKDATTANQEVILRHGPTRCITVAPSVQKCSAGVAAGRPETQSRVNESQGGEDRGEGEGSHNYDDGVDEALCCVLSQG